MLSGHLTEIGRVRPRLVSARACTVGLASPLPRVHLIASAAQGHLQIFAGTRRRTSDARSAEVGSDVVRHLESVQGDQELLCSDECDAFLGVREEDNELVTAESNREILLSKI